jgi:hypothetical protein
VKEIIIVTKAKWLERGSSRAAPAIFEPFLGI